MSTGHAHTDAHGCEATYRLLCELFDEDTAPERREEIKNDLAACPECLAVAQSERDVRAMVRVASRVGDLFSNFHVRKYVRERYGVPHCQRSAASKEGSPQFFS